MSEKKENSKEQKKEKGIMETIRDVNRKERQERIHSESERIRDAARIKEQADEEYRQQLQREKIELMKSKQGLADSEEAEIPEEAKKYTLWQRISTFFYCNKPMIIICTFAVVLVSFLITDIVRKPRPDFTVMVVAKNETLEFSTDLLEDVIEEYIPDINGNGEVLSSVYYMPLGDVDDYTSQASTTKLYVIMQDGETLLVIGDRESAPYLHPDETLENLEELYPGNEHVRGYGFYLAGTSFAEDIGYSGELSEGMFIGIRKLRTDVSFSKKMQENYPYAKDLLDRLVERYS